MKPYYEDRYVQIYLGDCREILPQLPKVDLLFLDPPFEQETYYSVPVVPKDNSTIIAFSRFPHSGHIQILLEKQCCPVNEYIWYDSSVTSFRSESRPLVKHENIMIFFKGKGCIDKQVLQSPSSPVFRRVFKTSKNRKQNCKPYYWSDGERRITSLITIDREHISHTAVGTKPTKLVSLLLSIYSFNNSLILDPFLGSGTTAYCAKKLNRRCIGIEIEEKYCEISANRCRQEVMELKL